MKHSVIFEILLRNMREKRERRIEQALVFDAEAITRPRSVNPLCSGMRGPVHLSHVQAELGQQYLGEQYKHRSSSLKS